MIHGASLFRSGAVERLGIPAIETSDGPMGVRAEFMDDRWIPAGNQDDMVSYLPSNSALASSWNTELAYRTGHILGAEARGRGKDVILAPGINIKRDPLCGRNFEYYSEDPLLTGRLAGAMVRGIQSQTSLQLSSTLPATTRRPTESTATPGCPSGPCGRFT